MFGNWRDRLNALHRFLRGLGSQAPADEGTSLTSDDQSPGEPTADHKRLQVRDPRGSPKDERPEAYPPLRDLAAETPANRCSAPNSRTEKLGEFTADKQLSQSRTAQAARAKKPKHEVPPATKSKPRPLRKRQVPDSKGTGRHSTALRKKSSVSINLGIDFGTSFSKVCFRDIGTEESGIVTFGAQRADDALIPTVVALDKRGLLFLGNEIGKKRDMVVIPYLKMRLADIAIGEPLSELNGVNLNEVTILRALASWFLAAVIVRSQSWIASHERDRLKGRDVVWSANVGVPVEHYDSGVLAVFHEVLGVAWQWVKHGILPSNLAEIEPAYKEAAASLHRDVSDFHAVPEIAAAVQSFVISREAVPGIYVYFDIGGGTLDGVAFNYINQTGERRINFYSGKVEPLGLSVLAEAMGIRSRQAIATATLDKHLGNCGERTSEEIAQKIRRLVAYVVITAKFKDGRNWQESAIQHPDIAIKKVGRLEQKRMRPLIVFVGGGGSPSSWYRAAINSTYARFQHHNADIPPYQLQEVPKPTDLSMNGIPDDEFRRFAISYGLSIPYGEGPEIRLPSQFDVAEKPRAWKPPNVTDYADSKDVS